MKVARIGIAGLLLAALALKAEAGMVDVKLLDMLLANGSITAGQHAELMSDLAAEQAAEAAAAKAAPLQLEERPVVAGAPARAATPPAPSAFEQAAAWATKTSFRGDIRVRHDHINVEGEPNHASTPPGGVSGIRDRDRQRIRIRLGAYTKVSPEVATTIRLASGNSADQRVPNQDFDNSFEKKQVWFDLGFIDYHPTAAPGLNLLAGKMLQPWLSVSQLVWDVDVNPEGFAARYTRKVGDATLFGSGGYFILKDGVLGDGIQFKEDLSLYALQAGATFDVGADAMLTVGASFNDYSGDGQRFGTGRPALSLIGNGNTTDKFKLFEGFAQLEVSGLPAPLSLIGNYAKNVDARDTPLYSDADQDTAWLVGMKTRVRGIGIEWNYRDVERNAVVGIFTESDFAAGFVTARGHQLKVDYDIASNLKLALTWMPAESDVASRYQDDADVETFQIDLNTKF